MIKTSLITLATAGLFTILFFKAGAQMPPAGGSHSGHEFQKINPEPGPKNEYIQNKLNHIIIPKIEFKGTSVREAIDFLRKKSVELDTTEPDPARKGVNIVFETEIFTPEGQPFPDRDIASTPDAKITLSMTNVPLSVALSAVTNYAGLLRYRVEPCAVVIVPILGDDFATKEYKVPKGFFADKDGHVQTARQFLESSGVTFPAGTDVIYIPASSKLVVRNSDENLDLVDQIVEDLNAHFTTPTPSPVPPKTKGK